jgi:hypothetical protein
VPDRFGRTGEKPRASSKLEMRGAGPRAQSGCPCSTAR